jgi:probable phosphoglycerate mutase
MTEFAIIRHGVTDWNLGERMQGHRDIPLNKTGFSQAARMGERLLQGRWDKIISSDLQRASQTALCIAITTGIKYRLTDSRLRERNLGRLEGTTIEERRAKWGEDWECLDHGVESDEQLFWRASACMEEWASEYRGQRIIIVTHGGWIRQFFRGVFPQQNLSHPKNTSLSIISRGIEGWDCLLYNCTSHLMIDPYTLV